MEWVTFLAISYCWHRWTADTSFSRLPIWGCLFVGDATFSGAGLGRWPTVYSCVGSLGSFEVSSVGILTIFTYVLSLLSFCSIGNLWIFMAWLSCAAWLHHLLEFIWSHLKPMSSSCLLQVTSHVTGVHCGCHLRRSGPLPVWGSLFCPSSCGVGMPDFRPWLVQGTSVALQYLMTLM